MMSKPNMFKQIQGSRDRGKFIKTCLNTCLKEIQEIVDPTAWDHAHNEFV